MTTNKMRVLGPAPEPKQRPDPSAMKQLLADTAELGGFTRPSSASGAELQNAPQADPIKAEEIRAEAPQSRAARKREEKTRDSEAPKGGVLKCDVGDELFEELRVAAVRRRVTVKYLLVEALAAQGYAHADLSAIPKDGRRDR
jgi:hypothetical protein